MNPLKSSAKPLSMRIRISVKRYMWYYLFMLPTIAFFIVFHYVPMYGVQIAFRNFMPAKGIWGSRWVGLANFRRFFSSYYVGRLFANTLLINLYDLAMFPIPILFALMLNEVRSARFKKVVQTVTYAPHFLSTVVFVSLTLSFLDPRTGVINRLIALLGGERINFISEPGMFKSIYVLSGVWKDSGWNAIIYLGALSGVDLALHEAAQIDGASRFKRILHINLPCLYPTIVILLVMQLGRMMSLGYERIYLMQNALNMAGSDVISTYVYRVGLAEAQYSLSAAVGLFNSLINMILLIAANTLSRVLTETSLW